MKLREYTRQDLPEVLSLFYTTVHAIGTEDFTREQLDAWAPSEADVDAWQQRLTSSTTFVAEHKDRIVGFGNVTVLGLIDTLYVHADAQNTGVGGALLMRLVGDAKSRGVRTIQTEANTVARSFFEKEGFVVTKEKIREQRGVEFSTFVMTMDLPEEMPEEA